MSNKSKFLHLNPLIKDAKSRLIITIASNFFMAAFQAPKQNLSFEDGWPILQEAVDRIIGITDGVCTDQFSSEEYMKFYTIAYEICQPNPFGPDVVKLYAQQKKTFEDFVTLKILPYLREKKDEILLQELVKRWENHKTFTRWITRFLHYLDRYYATTRKLPSVEGTSHLTFYNLVYGELNDQVKDAVLSMIDHEREGEEIDQVLVKKVLNTYIELGDGSKKYYEKDFEEALLKRTAAFYAERTSTWITSKSYKEYMIMVGKCFEQEKERISSHLQQKRQHKLLEVLQRELLTAHESRLDEKKQHDGEEVL